MSDITLNAFLSKMRVKNLTKKGGRICMKIRNGPLFYFLIKSKWIPKIVDHTSKWDTQLCGESLCGLTKTFKGLLHVTNSSMKVNRFLILVGQTGRSWRSRDSMIQTTYSHLGRSSLPKSNRSRLLSDTLFHEKK